MCHPFFEILKKVCRCEKNCSVSPNYKYYLIHASHLEKKAPFEFFDTLHGELFFVFLAQVTPSPAAAPWTRRTESRRPPTRPPWPAKGVKINERTGSMRTNTQLVRILVIKLTIKSGCCLRMCQRCWEKQKASKFDYISQNRLIFFCYFIVMATWLFI